MIPALVTKIPQMSKTLVPFRPPEVVESFKVGTLLDDPVWQRSDCLCRGGSWAESDLGRAETGFCVPGVPTGKTFDLATRGCVPIPGYRFPEVSGAFSFCRQGGMNICLIGGVAVGLLVLWAVLRKK